MARLHGNYYLTILFHSNPSKRLASTGANGDSVATPSIWP